MAFVVADRVKETTTTTGTGTINLAGAATGFQTFVAGIGTTNTCPYVIEDANGTGWEVGIGTVTDASPDTLARTTILASSNSGSAITLSSGTHTVFCGWSADLGKRSYLQNVTGANADTTMAVGEMYVVDMSGWATADRTYTLPATAKAGDRIGIMVTAGNASYELIIKPNTGDTINGGSAAAEWSRLFITGETVILRCVTADSAWVVEYDGRIPSKSRIYLSANTTNNSTGVVTVPLDTEDTTMDVGDLASTGSNAIVVRRDGYYEIQPLTSLLSLANDKYHYHAIAVNGTNVRTVHIQNNGSVGAASYLSGVIVRKLAVNDSITVQSQQNDSASESFQGGGDAATCSLTVVEVLP